MRNPPKGWGLLVAPVPGRSARTRCLLCGATGLGPYGKGLDYIGPNGWRRYPAPWQVPHIGGHNVQCVACRRPFTDAGAVASHRSCKLHHDCCRDHTTVPPWKNPFARREEEMKIQRAEQAS